MLVQPSNPNHIRSLADVAQKGIVLVNRGQGSRAESLQDQKLNETAVSTFQLNGYERIVGSNLEVARFMATSQPYVWIGVPSVARLLGLEFFPFQQALDGLVGPTAHLTDRPSTTTFMNTIVRRQFRTEIGALGGYDTTETGKIRQLRPG